MKQLCWLPGSERAYWASGPGGSDKGARGSKGRSGTSAPCLDTGAAYATKIAAGTLRWLRNYVFALPGTLTLGRRFRASWRPGEALASKSMKQLTDAWTRRAYEAIESPVPGLDTGATCTTNIAATASPVTQDSRFRPTRSRHRADAFARPGVSERR